MSDMRAPKTYEQLLKEIEELNYRLEEATDTIDAIRSGQVDALVVNDSEFGHQLYTLKTADQTYRVFIEKMNEGAVTLNADGIVLYANSKFGSMVGASLSEIVGGPFEKFVAPDFLDLFREVFAKGWNEDIQMELSILRNDEDLPCQASVTSLQLDEGPSLSIIITDLTFQKQIQHLLKENNRRLMNTNTELEASNHDLQQFASIASHDLQEPLRKILIFSTMLRDKHRSELPPESLTFLEKIISSSQRMRSMASDILNYARLSTHANNFEEVNLGEVVLEILDDYELLIRESNVTVSVQELPIIEGNRAQLKQAFQNLISNSIKFSRKDNAPAIRIFCKSGGSELVADDSAGLHCQIVVADNGIGFDKAFQERIFSLFERLNNKDQYEGSGIGLSITKKIVERHHGKISAESAPGEGARFTVSLPIRQPRMPFS